MGWNFLLTIIGRTFIIFNACHLGFADGSEEINGMEFPLLLLRFNFGSEEINGMEFPGMKKIVCF